VLHETNCEKLITVRIDIYINSLNWKQQQFVVDTKILVCVEIFFPDAGFEMALKIRPDPEFAR